MWFGIVLLFVALFLEIQSKEILTGNLELNQINVNDKNVNDKVRTVEIQKGNLSKNKSRITLQIKLDDQSIGENFTIN